jgi:hypothetical protein
MEVAAFIDRTLSDSARRDAETHLAACSVCREEVADCARLATATVTGQPSRTFSWRWIGVAAAAGLVSVVIGLPAWRGRGGTSEERSPTSAPGIVAVFPPAGSTQHVDVRFTWRSISGAVTYAIVVSDTSGALVWHLEGADTTATAPANTLRAGQRYYWRVDALSRDGHDIVGTAQPFTVSQ